MSLSNIRQANKKNSREQRRKKRRHEMLEHKRANQIINKRLMKAIAQGKREHLKRRNSEAAYINSLAKELGE